MNTQRKLKMTIYDTLDALKGERLIRIEYLEKKIKYSTEKIEFHQEKVDRYQAELDELLKDK